MVRKSQKEGILPAIMRPYKRKANETKETKENQRKQMEVTPMKYVCDVCGWEYDEELGCPEKGIAPGTPWAEVHDDFECPLCFVGKDQFSEA